MQHQIREPLSFQALPVDVKITIFSYFTQEFLSNIIARVCKTWWELSKDPSLWRNLYFVCEPGENSGDRLKTVLTRSTMLRRLTIHSDENYRTRAINIIGEGFSSSTLKVLSIDYAVLCERLVGNLENKFPSLESLDFYKCNTEEGAMELAEKICKLSKLKDLRIKVYDISDQFDDLALNTIAENFTNLQTLELYCSCDLSTPCIQNLVRLRLETLKCVMLSGCEWTDDGVSCFSLCTGLTKLMLGCTAGITDAAFDAIKELHLEVFTFYTLSFAVNTRVSSQALARFFGSPCRQNLKILSLTGFRNLQDEVLILVAKTSTNLTHLDIRDTDLVTDSGLTTCVNSLSKLSYLRCKECPSVTWNMIWSIPITVQVETDIVQSDSSDDDSSDDDSLYGENIVWFNK